MDKLPKPDHELGLRLATAEQWLKNNGYSVMKFHEFLDDKTVALVEGTSVLFYDDFLNFLRGRQ